MACDDTTYFDRKNRIGNGVISLSMQGFSYHRTLSNFLKHFHFISRQSKLLFQKNKRVIPAHSRRRDIADVAKNGVKHQNDFCFYTSKTGEEEQEPGNNQCGKIV